MNMDSIAERALAEVARRLESITVANGYSTDAGLRVFRARRSISKTDLPCVVVWAGQEAIENGDGSHLAYSVVLSIIVDGHVMANQLTTGKTVEGLRADIKRAVLSDRSGALSDSVGNIGLLAILSSDGAPRDDGGESETVAVQFSASYREAHGNPFSSQQE